MGKNVLLARERYWNETDRFSLTGHEMDTFNVNSIRLWRIKWLVAKKGVRHLSIKWVRWDYFELFGWLNEFKCMMKLKCVRSVFIFLHQLKLKSNWIIIVINMVNNVIRSFRSFRRLNAENLWKLFCLLFN